MDANRVAIWVCYTVLNYAGCILCGVLCFSVKKMPRKSPHDILLAGVCSGCIWVSAACGTQYLANIAYGDFYGSKAACGAEAFFHTSGDLIQFFSVAAVSLRNYFTVVHSRDLKIKSALACVGCIWFISMFGTALAGYYSDSGLISSGTICSYGFRSYAIAYWLMPVLAIVLCIMCISYGALVRQIHKLQAHMHLDDDFTTACTVVKRSLLFIIALLAGTMSICITVVYEHLSGPATPSLTLAVGIGGAINSLLVPLAYGLSAPYHRRALCRLFRGSLLSPRYGWMVGRSAVAEPMSPRCNIARKLFIANTLSPGMARVHRASPRSNGSTLTVSGAPMSESVRKISSIRDASPAYSDLSPGSAGIGMPGVPSTPPDLSPDPGIKTFGDRFRAANSIGVMLLPPRATPATSSGHT